jgi:glycolate oxidase iron-sulfur subunit
MQTTLTEAFLQSAAGKAADQILRNCVHCGFCNATCPTYQLTGDELDGPRGRIYLIKQVLEGQSPSERTRLHLDRCLTCRACETTCPSGVEYHHLLETGRQTLEDMLPRPPLQRGLRWLLRKVLTRPRLFTPLLKLGQWTGRLLPEALHKKIPRRQACGRFTSPNKHARTMLLLDGCVQPALAPQINTATRRVLDRLGITTVIAAGSGCCGAVSHHLDAPGEARNFMRHNIDAWWPAVEAGAEAIVVTASGCAPMVKDYGRLLADDSDYAGKAARIGELARDISEVISSEQPLERLSLARSKQKITFHSPCTLQHAQQLNGVVEVLLEQAGYELLPVTDSHLCCGSAGTYTILQPQLAAQLRDNKLTSLQEHGPAMIATANIGCLTHMANHAHVPVKHWIELIDTLLPETN